MLLEAVAALGNSLANMATNQPAALVVDYLGMMQFENADTMQQGIANAARKLKPPRQGDHLSDRAVSARSEVRGQTE